MTAPEKNTLQLDTEPIGRLLCKTTLPALISVLAYNLYHIADTFFVAKGSGTDAAGGLAVSFPLFLFLSAVTSMLGSGGASVLSRALGRKEREKANRVIANCFCVFFAISLSITITGLLFLEPLLHAMGVTDALMPYASTYTRIILSAAAMSTGFSSLIRAEGSSRYAMYIWLIPIGINLVADPLLILVLDMKTAGAAFGTALSWCVSMGMSIWYFFLSPNRNVRIRKTDFLPDPSLLAEIFAIGVPAFIQTAGYSLSVVFVNRILKGHGGTTAISTYGIVSKLYTFLLLGITALMQGIQPVIGYHYGKNDRNRVRKTLKISCRIAGLYGIAVIIVLLLSAQTLLHIMTSDQKVIAAGKDILLTMGCGMPFYGIYCVQSVYFQAAGKRISSLFLSLCNHILFLFPAILLLSRLSDASAIWYAFPVSAFLSMCIACGLLKKESRSNHIPVR